MEKKRVMVVEDSADMQEIYRDMFAGEEKYTLDFFDKAEAAIEKLKIVKYDLIILDIIMEPMPGDSFFVIVRKELKMETVPIIVVSVLSPSILGRLSDLNHVVFFQKPINKETLIKKIEEVTAKSGR